MLSLVCDAIVIARAFEEAGPIDILVFNHRVFVLRRSKTAIKIWSTFLALCFNMRLFSGDDIGSDVLEIWLVFKELGRGIKE